MAELGSYRLTVLSNAGVPIEIRGVPVSGTFATPLFLVSRGSQIVASAMGFVDSNFGLHLYSCTVNSGCDANHFGSVGFGPGMYGTSGKPDIGLDGSVWIADMSVGLMKFNPSGVLLDEVPIVGVGADQVQMPTAVEIANDGTIWVADGMGQQIQHYDESGAHLGTTPTGVFGQAYAFERLLDGSFLVGSLDTQTIRRVRVDGSVVWSRQIPALGPGGVLDLGDGTALVGVIAGRALQIDLATGETVRQLSFAPDQYTTTPISFTKTSDGKIIAADGANSRLLVISLHQPEVPVVEPLVIEPAAKVPSTSSGTGTLAFTVGGGSGAGYTYAASWKGSAAAIGSNGVLNLRDLPEGRSVLRVVITDSVGATAVWEHEVVIDRTAPIVARGSQRLAVSSSVVVGVEDALSAPTEASVRVAVKKIGKNVVRVRLTDTVGNSTVRSFTVIRRPSLSRGPLNNGVEMWRPGSTFTPGSAQLEDVFGNGAKKAFGRQGKARSPYAPALVREVQYRLKQVGYISRTSRSSGELDRSTRIGLRIFQRAHGLPKTGLPDAATRLAMDHALEASLGLRRR